VANANLYFHLIRRPLMTEKSSTLQDLNNQYVFEVAPVANKSEIKKAVEVLFSVKVSRVNIINLPGKIRRTFGRPGMSSGWKKAVVTLKKGDTIEIA